ncbi:MAG: hypothetical protein JXA90_10110, partial [Planctomycetes bacterium]|nr:hypothetical protein [Planctomycetota bacterium]
MRKGFSRSVRDGAVSLPWALRLGVLALISWLAGAAAVRAETIVEGTIDVQEWTEAESPYHATADLELPAGMTLALEAGVEVRFDPGVSLVVRGTLSVLGIEDKPVRFCRADSEEAWGGVAFRGSDSSGTLEHLELSGASTV